VTTKLSSDFICIWKNSWQP